MIHEQLIETANMCSFSWIPKCTAALLSSAQAQFQTIFGITGFLARVLSPLNNCEKKNDPKMSESCSIVQIISVYSKRRMSFVAVECVTEMTAFVYFVLWQPNFIFPTWSVCFTGPIASNHPLRADYRLEER
jgi:hypothetical protein